MAYCKNCGQQIDDRAVVCPRCGASQITTAVPAEDDTGSIGWGILGFCIPLVGLILYLVWKDTKPLSSKVAGKGALISVIVSVVLYVLMIVLGVGASILGAAMY